MFFLRGPLFIWIAYNCMLTFWVEEDWKLLGVTCVILIIFGLFNVLIVIVPLFERAVKWFKKSVDSTKKLK